MTDLTAHGDGNRCDHGMSAHTIDGCLHCPCKVPYPTRADRPVADREALSDREWRPTPWVDPLYPPNPEPLTTEEEVEFRRLVHDPNERHRSEWWAEFYGQRIDRLLATLDAARSRPASETEASLRAALEECRQHHADTLAGNERGQHRPASVEGEADAALTKFEWGRNGVGLCSWCGTVRGTYDAEAHAADCPLRVVRAALPASVEGERRSADGLGAALLRAYDLSAGRPGIRNAVRTAIDGLTNAEHSTALAALPASTESGSRVDLWGDPNRAARMRASAPHGDFFIVSGRCKTCNQPYPCAASSLPLAPSEPEAPGPEGE
jgi:hypothetical protein